MIEPFSKTKKRCGATPTWFLPNATMWGFGDGFLTWGRCRWHWVKTGLPSTTGWWWLEHDWIMTFQKQLGMESSSQLTKSYCSEGLVETCWNHQPGMVSIGKSTPIPLLCTPQRLKKTSWAWDAVIARLIAQMPQKTAISTFPVSVDPWESGWWFGTWLDYNFPYIGNSNPNWRTPSFFRGIGQPPTRSCFPQNCWSWSKHHAWS